MTKTEMKLKLATILQEDKEIGDALRAHNAKVEASFEAETKALKLRADIHNQKAAEFMRDLGIGPQGNLLELVSVVASIDD